MENKNEGLISVLIILSLLVVGLGGYIVYDKMFIKSSKTETNDNQNSNESKDDDSKISNNTYKISDYVVVSDFEFNKNCINCGTYGTVKKIEFKNLPIGTTAEFIKLHENFIHPSASEIGKLTNSVVYGTYNNVLSVYSEEKTEYDDFNPQNNNYSLNVNLDNKKIITNRELIDMYKIDVDSIYKKILNEIALTVKTDKFLLDINGNVDAPTISITEFKNNITNYSEILNNRYDIFTLYVKDDKVNCVYYQNKILELLGMGTHMGIGLVSKYQTIILN